MALITRVSRRQARSRRRWARAAERDVCIVPHRLGMPPLAAVQPLRATKQDGDCQGTGGSGTGLTEGKVVTQAETRPPMCQESHLFRESRRSGDHRRKRSVQLALAPPKDLVIWGRWTAKSPVGRRVDDEFDSSSTPRAIHPADQAEEMWVRFRDELGRLRFTPARATRAIGKRVSWVLLSVLVLAQNRLSRRPITAPGSGVAVSITSYGSRADSVYRTIESIARGRLLPESITLYVPKEKSGARGLERLVARGLVVAPDDPEIGPHNKYYNYVQSTTDYCHALVTIDDDVFVTKSWLSDLHQAFTRGGGQFIVANWARTMLIRAQKLAPSAEWLPCGSDKPSRLTALSGVWGVIYPPAFLPTLRDLKPDFMERSPKADDVWLNLQALRGDFLVQQRLSHRRPYIPRYIAQRDGVSQHNLYEGGAITHRGNDHQIAASYGEADVAKLVLASREET